MRMLAALLIDAENISSKYANYLHQILSAEALRGVSVVARLLVGNAQSTLSWSMAIHSYFQVRIHQGGKNAADYLLRDEALKLAPLGVRRFYLVSNDRSFATTAALLRFLGCQVIGFGTTLAAKRWQDSCDLFIRLGTTPSTVEATLVTAFDLRRRSFTHSKGNVMEPFSFSDISSLPDAEKIQQALQMIYGSTTQPPLLTSLLFLFLQHTFTALCLTEQDSTFPGQWSAISEVESLTAYVQDPIISVILEQDDSLRIMWQTMMAFAYRCRDAYEQGQNAARHTFPHFPRQRVSVLQQEHLACLEASWHYAATPEEAQRAYPGYSPEAEHKVLLRWFRRGYLSGAEMDAEGTAQGSEEHMAKW